MTHPAAAQFAEIRAWLQNDAAAKSLEGIRDYVNQRFERLAAQVANAAPAQLAARPSPGEWSPLETLQHLVQWNWQVGEDILHVSLMGERPGNPPPSFPLESDELLRRGRESLDSVWAHVSAADPTAFLDITWEHPFFGQLNWREWYLFLSVHIIDHAGQIKSAMGATDA